MEHSWPRARLGEGLHALARKTGLRRNILHIPHIDDPPNAPPPEKDTEQLHEWLDTAAAWLGVEAQALSLPHPELYGFLTAAGPAIVRVSDDAFLLVVDATRRGLRVLDEDARVHTLTRKSVGQALQKNIEGNVAAEVDALLEGVSLSGQVRAYMIEERLHDETFEDIWLLRAPAGTSVAEDVRHAGLSRLLAAFAASYFVEYGLFVASWWLLGRGALRGQIDGGWLAAWALLFMTMLPFRMVATWYEGRVAVAAGALLKRRLLIGAMRLDPDETRKDGAGRHMARVLESEAVESLAMSGGLLSAAGFLQLAVCSVVLALGSGGIVHVLLLALTVVLFMLVAWRYFRKRRRWTSTRFRLSQDLIERMVGHRTRLAQLAPIERHEREDVSLAGYLEDARAADRVYGLLFVIARVWFPIGFFVLAPAFIAGQASLGRLAVALGGVILAARALDQLASGFADLLDAGIAWQRIAPLFHAASREPTRGDPSVLSLARRSTESRRGRPILDVSELSYRYFGRSEPAIRGTSFGVSSGDQVLLTSPSGGGKSTLVSLLNGLRRPTSGTLLLEGVDPISLGAEAWTRRVATAPQFHDNHVFTEVFAFNLLMGRRWPPTARDWEEAETTCEELGLSPLLTRMPGGMNQLIGDTGWQLSHGERSRLYLARALLQGGELVLLDESFGALDPDNLRKALTCARKRAESLMVIAHP